MKLKIIWQFFFWDTV